MRNVTEFIFLGITQIPQLKKFLSIMCFMTYLITLAGNTLISITIFISPALASPFFQYFFLSCLSIIDGFYSSCIAPKMVIDLISKRSTISFNTGIIVHTAMAYDRYVAISKLLHHETIMSRPVCAFLVGATMILGFVHGRIQILFIDQLPFCGPSVTDHFLCDLIQLLELACTETHTLEPPLITASTAALCSLTFSMLAPCPHVPLMSQLSSYSLYLYLRPMISFPTDKAVTVFYSLIIPSVNPLIYILRNEEVKKVVKKLWGQDLKR
uniref:G-protein coupled receptors family 1 profile domain-containing protein n=1 Tax=Cavia porcellus TaxID=10141 RepID=A0A286Y2H1_CAVPO